jgi:lipid II:glycine glycyltransferase (peptidoglycan interpeptide bridge formation enzyme)
MSWSQAINEKEWNRLVEHPLQTWEWGNFREKSGVRVLRIVIDNGKNRVPIQLSFHQLGPLPFTIGYAPKGPIITDTLLDSLQEAASGFRPISILLEPNITASNQPEIRNLKLKKAHRPLFTKHSFILDLSRSEDTLLASMHPKTRYNIKVAIRHGVAVAQDNSDRAFENYLELTEKTAKRQGFYAHDRTYHRNLWDTLKPGGMARLFTATYQKKTIAAWMVFVFKKTIYYPYGASDRHFKQVMAPNLLAWEIIRWAKNQDLQAFDMWGALGPDADPKDPWYGFHKFKLGYHPTPITYAGSYDLIINPRLYQLFIKADSLRWAGLHLLRKGLR